MSKNLKNYLRSYRKRAGFTQDEVAYLLGCQSGAKTSRYERHARVPNLKTEFAYQVIFGATPQELFPGIYAEVEKEIKRRVRGLERKLSKAPQDRKTERKLVLLKTIITRLNDNAHNL